MQELSPAKKIKLSARDFLIRGGVVAFVTAVTYYFNSRRREVDLRFGAELDWSYDWDHPLRPWRVRHPDGSLELTLEPRYDKHTTVNALVLRTEVHQVFGRWSGTVTDDDGAVHRLDGIQGFAEESRSRW